MLGADKVRGQIDWLMAHGIEAARAGERQRAREIFTRVIRLHQRSEKAWWWLSTVVDNPADKAVCLENVLTINPDNLRAAADFQDLRQQPKGQEAQSSQLPKLTSARAQYAPSERAADADVPPPPVERACPRCGFGNPGWSYVCDRCGADLQPLDLYKVLGPGAHRRQPGFITVLEAWAATFIFNRLWAFLPEIELASWGRSLTALGMAALVGLAWRPVVSVGLQLLTDRCDPGRYLPSGASRYSVETLLLALPLLLIWWGIALPTWLGARAVGGRRNLKTHAHLIAIALSAWLALGALLAPIPGLARCLWEGRGLASVVGGLPILLSSIVGAAGVIWLTQAVQTAQDLSFASAALITLLLVVLSLLTLYGLNLLTAGRLPESLGQTLSLFFLPWLGGGG